MDNIINDLMKIFEITSNDTFIAFALTIIIILLIIMLIRG